MDRSKVVKSKIMNILFWQNNAKILTNTPSEVSVLIAKGTFTAFTLLHQGINKYILMQVTFYNNIIVIDIIGKGNITCGGNLQEAGSCCVSFYCEIFRVVA